MSTHPFLPVAATVHAKINLYLAVGAERPDGYHDLTTVFQSVSARDEVSLNVAEQAAPGEDVVRGLSVDKRLPGEVPTHAGNLAWQAVRLVVQAYRDRHGPRLLPGVKIHIDKKIPVAGGMAGGSADAAAALVAADAWLAVAYGREPLGARGLYPLARQLGADVPFVLAGQTAFGTGRGDELVTMLTRGQFHWAVVTSPQGLSTPEVFQRLDAMRAAGDVECREPDTQPVAEALAAGDVECREPDTQPVAEALAAGDTEKLAGALHNDLQAAALSLRPELRKILRVGVSEGALAGLVSGSGPTCVFLCPDAHAADEVAQAVAADNPGTRGMAVTGPAPGAELVSATRAD
ncbi:4-(cytidine 5'-diphospho)-2-C-methyl-D-erythritol kinase [Corynebacterium yudongzhengii]|uniref:4-diphosphocytidyl-2-C-methyl-D-erythritol kinase n=1 Tax=Corynebacterium yudongzhengii TaxID=2080740 RepID=A0A2U1T7W6_9CORY|nr:4-(cytidine 5'-diphospho)-2-C-methyl-D-erythritol kinase [Corynebacterium yudongzhengii]AWB82285.1 4-(cytidine 5'-diphospho)-2-C-methyl-D-erythritol kinase [Corynebacterium yudongzhengii]PWC02096.1 4-(cytidine 5'-diphospho)-2-C-methyl-D-erythritol kinase [Corynebacterium yudongzhengii]